jgi:hypothetical protein
MAHSALSLAFANTLTPACMCRQRLISLSGCQLLHLTSTHARYLKHGPALAMAGQHLSHGLAGLAPHTEVSGQSGQGLAMFMPQSPKQHTQANYCPTMPETLLNNLTHNCLQLGGHCCLSASAAVAAVSAFCFSSCSCCKLRNCCC